MPVLILSRLSSASQNWNGFSDSHSLVLSYVVASETSINLRVLVLFKDAYYFLLLWLIHVFNIFNSQLESYTAFWRTAWPFSPFSLSLSRGKWYVHGGRENVRHSFLHGGPCLQGLSPAVVHVLLGRSPETATVTLEDCPDLDIRETIRLVCLIKNFFFL